MEGSVGVRDGTFGLYSECNGGRVLALSVTIG